MGGRLLTPTMDAKLKEALDASAVVFFDMAGCPFCRMAEDALKGAGIEYTKLNIADYKPALVEATGKTSAPSVWIKGEYVGGCNDGTEAWHGVKPMIANGKFKEMLA